MANCSVVLEDIDTSCETITGGIDQVYIANFGDVEKITESTDKITAIQMAQGTKFNTFSFRKQSSGLTSEMQADDIANTKFFNSNVTLRFAKMETAKRVSFMALCTGEFRVIVKDNNGLYWLLGKDRTVTATAANGGTGTSFTDPNEYGITLTAMDNQLPLEVDSTIIEGLLSPAV